jgi:TBC1 domain family protein 5
VSRTYQDKELFQTQIVKEIMFNILFIWSKENKNISYKQGMNELLAVIIFSLYPFYFYSSDKSKKTFENIATMMRAYEEKHLKDIYLFFHDMEEFQSDLFFLFDAIMNKGIKDLFDTAIGKKSELSSYKKQDLFQPQWTDDNETDAVSIYLNIGSNASSETMSVDYQKEIEIR